MLSGPASMGEAAIFLIAEGGTAHGGNVEKAHKLITAAKEAGAAAVKFQVIFADELLHQNVGVLRLLGENVSLYHKFKALERNDHFYRSLKEKADAEGILFLASAFGRRSLELLNRLGTTSYKLASPELSFYQLWEELIKARKLVMASTGMHTEYDIRRLVTFLTQQLRANGEEATVLHQRLVLLQCLTCYPAVPEAYNLLALERLRLLTGVAVGLSDHTSHATLLPLLAAALHALHPVSRKKSAEKSAWVAEGNPFIIEKHLTLDRKAGELDDKLALLPAAMKKLQHDLVAMQKTIFAGTFNNSPELEQYRHYMVEKQLVPENIAAKGYFPLALPQSAHKRYHYLRALLSNERKAYLSKLLVTLLAPWQDWAGKEALVYNCLGSGIKTLAACEQPYYPTSRRSLVATRDINAGEVVSSVNSALLRAEQGNEAGLSAPAAYYMGLNGTKQIQTRKNPAPTCHANGQCYTARKALRSGAGITLAKIAKNKPNS